MYSSIPDQMMTSIQRMASNIADGAERGVEPPKNLFEMGKQVADEMDPAEMQNFTTSMMQNMKMFTSLCSSFMGDKNAESGSS